MSRLVLLCLAAALLALTVACEGDSGSGSTSRPEGSLRGKVTVFAAASLTDAFNEIAAEFKRKNPDTDVEFNFGGSPTLRTQLEQGARADVYASADTNQMNLAREHGVADTESRVFARNSLVIIMPKGNPGRINAPVDLRKNDLKLVLANPDVPVGSYARQALASMEKDPAYGPGFAGTVLKNVVSLESNVKQVVAKVELGEADGGIVYGTDVTPSVGPNLATVKIPEQFNVIAEYPIALTKTPANTLVAQAFIDFVLNTDGQTILKKYGFQTLG